jgi:hypothetical protein
MKKVLEVALLCVIHLVAGAMLFWFVSISPW